MSKIVYICLAGLALGFSNLAFSADTNSGCGNFHLQISNLSSVACILTNQEVTHGNLISSPPTSIMPSDSKTFDMEQTLYGPEIALTYKCGQDVITLKSKQNLCFLKGGAITGSEPFPINNIKASYTAVEGTFFWGKPGNINWQISNV